MSGISNIIVDFESLLDKDEVFDLSLSEDGDKKLNHGQNWAPQLEIWLKNIEMGEEIQFPVLPPAFSVTMDNGHSTVNVQTKGDVTILGKRGLKSIEWKSFFPDQTYDFAQYGKITGPYLYVRKLEKWAESPLLLNITDTNIAMNVVIQSFSYSEDDGTGDVNYTLSLKEYRPPTYKENVGELEEQKPDVEIEGDSGNPNKGFVSRPTNQSKPKTHTVKKNDTLMSIAKKYYGSSSKHAKIYEANKTVIEKTAKKHGKTSSTHKGVKGWWLFPGTKLVLP